MSGISTKKDVTIDVYNLQISRVYARRVLILMANDILLLQVTALVTCFTINIFTNFSFLRVVNSNKSTPVSYAAMTQNKKKDS